ncbi:MAG: hypothetical protein AAF646_15425 [Pseudomonadota bacterium]
MLVGLSTPVPILAGSALFVLGAASFGMIAVRVPAFNEALQVTTVTGSQRVNDAYAMYDMASYLQAAGDGFLHPETQGVIPPEAPEARDRYAQLATGYLVESLRRDPANAQTWILYGAALAARGESAAAGEALALCKALGPAQPELAAARLNLVATLRGLTGDTTAHDELARADLALLEALAPDVAEAAAAALANVPQSERVQQPEVESGSQ